MPLATCDYLNLNELELNTIKNSLLLSHPTFQVLSSHMTLLATILNTKKGELFYHYRKIMLALF